MEAASEFGFPKADLGKDLGHGFTWEPLVGDDSWRRGEVREKEGSLPKMYAVE